MKKAQVSQPKKSTRKGFTLVEFLIVIAILGILIGTVLASINFARQKAQEAKAKSELKQIVKKLTLVQSENERSTRSITGSGCTECACRNGIDMRNIPETHNCFINWRNARIALAAEIGEGEAGFDKPVRDPWGSPYGLDENEGENHLNICIQDTVTSFGPDGIDNTGDDINYKVPFSGQYTCP